MLPDLIIVQRAPAPKPLQVQLLDQDGRAPDLTGKAVTCRVKRADGCGSVIVSTLDPTADILNAKGGYVQHRWAAPEIDQPGLLLVQFTVAGGQTYPVSGRFYAVEVTPLLL